jgi:hypothetical protein
VVFDGLISAHVKLPAFQFYPGDWRKDVGVQSLDFHARGVWFEILCLMHESERRGVLTLNGAAMPDDALARLLGISEDLLKQNLTKIEGYGVSSREPSTGALTCRRMVRDEELRKIRSEAGKMGGNPLLVKQNQTSRLKQKTTPSSSSSVSSSESDAATREIARLPDGLKTPEFQEAWLKWMHWWGETFDYGKPLQWMTADAHLKICLQIGPTQAVQAINNAISKRLREPGLPFERNGGAQPKPDKVRIPANVAAYIASSPKVTPL